MVSSPISNSLCIKCKGRLFCGLPRCPVFERLSHRQKISFKLSKDFKSKSPGIFIGWHGYPKVFAGVLSPINVEDASIQDDPSYWVSKNFSISNIMSLRQSLINSRRRTEIKNPESFREVVADVALSSKPLSVDVTLKKKPSLRINFTQHALPMGPSGEVNKIILEDNPSIKSPIKRVYYDTDFLANDAMNYLYSKKIDVFNISKLLSAGTLGYGHNRKLVPTRWAITATDDSLSKEHLNHIRNSKIIDNYLVFRGHYLGNYFTILLMPYAWSFELFEVWNPGAVYSGTSTNYVTDFEGFFGRKSYAENCGGGYYASRLPITDYLSKNKIQASVLAIREVTPEYYMPLGVWVVRQAMTNAINNKKSFSNLSDAKTYIQRLTGFDLRRSKLLKNQQSVLNKFLK
jgi:hypothetical protein